MSSPLDSPLINIPIKKYINLRHMVTQVAKRGVKTLHPMGWWMAGQSAYGTCAERVNEENKKQCEEKIEARTPICF